MITSFTSNFGIISIYLDDNNSPCISIKYSDPIKIVTGNYGWHVKDRFEFKFKFCNLSSFANLLNDCV